MTRPRFHSRFEIDPGINEAIPGKNSRLSNQVPSQRQHQSNRRSARRKSYRRLKSYHGKESQIEQGQKTPLALPTVREALVLRIPQEIERFVLVFGSGSLYGFQTPSQNKGNQRSAFEVSSLAVTPIPFPRINTAFSRSFQLFRQRDFPS